MSYLSFIINPFTALAISDMICCISLLPNGFKGPKQNFFKGRTFWILYEIYGIYIQNVFGHISTWLIVTVGISRHIAICHPFTSREIITLRRTMIAMLIVTVAWLLLDLPYIWSYSVTTIPCANNITGITVYYSLDIGFLSSNHSFNRTFTCTGIIFGFLLPVAILCYCTFSLVKAVKSSQTLQKQHSANRRESTIKPATSHVTVTLITIVIFYIILILPSECLQIWYFFSSASMSELTSTVAVICNAFHTLHYAINFILYTVVNSQFRKTVMDLFLCRKQTFRNRTDRSLYQTSVTNCSFTSL